MKTPAILLLLAGTLGCAASGGTGEEEAADASAAVELLREANVQFAALRSLAGDWSGTGCEGTDRDPVEIRFRVLEDGGTVEETRFPGTAGEVVARYRVENGKVTLTQASANGHSRMASTPSQVPIRSTMKFRGSFREQDACGEMRPPTSSVPSAPYEVTSAPDPSMRIIDFEPVDAAIDPVPDGQLLGASLWILGKDELSTLWTRSRNHEPELKRYHLTRKPLAVARTKTSEIE